MAVTVQNVRDYMGAAAAQWSDAEIASALAAELRNQTNKCRTITPTPDDMTEALKRRVARNFAMRKVPLGIAVSEVEATQVRSLDGEIKRFEAAYRKLPTA